MIVFYIITCILCIALVYITKCYATVYEKTRVDKYEYWNTISWKKVGKPKFPRWYIILSIILSFVPILNVLLIIGVVVNYIIVNIEPDDYSRKLTSTRISLDKVNKWVSWLFEKV
jgi:hypothetical protein